MKKILMREIMDSLPYRATHSRVENDVGHDIALADLFIAFLFPIRLGNIHEGGGERVVGDEGGGKADDGK